MGGALDLPDGLLLHCCGQSVHDDLVLAGKKVGVYHPLYRGSVPVHNDRVDVALGYGHLHYGGPLTATRFLFGHICFVGIVCHDDVSQASGPQTITICHKRILYTYIRDNI